MTLQSGARLGPYEVVSPLGAGGMGEVYRARDRQLGREVAIKVLPAAVADDREALSRFEREARAVAQLSHPNILTIFDFGREGETVYAVMELLEGETLRARLRNGRLPSRKAVELAVQVAEALAAAHEKGIVHRDLKPENIFVTGEGRVKLLDFGLARNALPGNAVDSRMQTLDQQTEPGKVMGTVGYMSPEQVRGETADQRSDIFSFGAVLYEMLTGRQAFRRDTAAETMMAIMKEDPPELTLTGAGASPELQRIVQHCLEKKPGERFQSARDIAFYLNALSSPTRASGASTARPRRRSRLWLAVVGIAGALAVAGVFVYWTGQQAGLRRASEVGFQAMTFRPQAIFQAAFSPDGATIVYSAALEGNIPDLFTIRPEYSEPQPLGLPHTHLLSISSKGELAVLINPVYIAHRHFIGTLARVSLGGTAPREILENVRQADWSPDGSELAILRSAQGKDRLEYPIGRVIYETAGWLSDLRVSPDGGRFALFEHPSRWDDRGSVIVVDRAGKRSVLSGEYWGEEGLAWSPKGNEILFTAGLFGVQTLYAVDLAGHRRIALQSAGGLTMQDISRRGSWLVTRDDIRAEISAQPSGESSEHDISWLDGSGFPSLSNDATKLLFVDQSASAGSNYRVCLRKTSGGPVVYLGEGFPQGLSPDGRWALAIIFTPPKLVLYPTGPGETRRLPQGDIDTYHSASWFPDGKSVLVCGNEARKAARCYIQDISDGSPRPVTPDGVEDGFVSPDGQRILCSKADGTWFIHPLSGGASRSVPGLGPEDEVIRWRGDGQVVFIFRGGNMPYRIEAFDVVSGKRQLVREIAPKNRTGVIDKWGAALAQDGTSYAYSYYRMTSQLFAVDRSSAADP